MPQQSSAPEYESPNDRLALNENRARQAVLLGHMRYVLLASLALVIAGFAILYFLLPH